ncbi:MAG: polymer-forming cytoskeletal protein [Lachnospiraceae bacterium]
MSFFKEFKEDLSQAVNEMLPGEEVEKTDELEEIDGKTEELDLGLNDELNKLDGLLEETKTTAAVDYPRHEKKMNKPEFPKMSMEQTHVSSNKTAKSQTADELAIITNGMILTGNLESAGSIEVRGLINGNVQCNGKLVVTGTINGNTTSAEFFADSAKVEGEIEAEGTVKIGSGSVVVGNVTATSAVIAGAIKGDIDVRGPVVVDNSAVVMGNIKSKSVQINNGAVIEGFCSQCYSDIDVKGIFG